MYFIIEVYIFFGQLWTNDCYQNLFREQTLSYHRKKVATSKNNENKSHELRKSNRKKNVADDNFSCVLNYVSNEIIIVNTESMLVCFQLLRLQLNTDGNIKMLESRHVNYNTNCCFRKKRNQRRTRRIIITM